MTEKYIPLDDRPDKKIIRIIMVLFGILCLITSSWWALYLVKYPGNENVFWIATAFLLLFGLYQIYSGLGFAARYIKIEGQQLTIRQNSIAPSRIFGSDKIEKIEIGTMDIVINLSDGGRYRIKLGLKYPDLGENIKERIIEFATENRIDLFYRHEKI